MGLGSSLRYGSFGQSAFTPRFARYSDRFVPGNEISTPALFSGSWLSPTPTQRIQRGTRGRGPQLHSTGIFRRRQHERAQPGTNSFIHLLAATGSGAIFQEQIESLLREDQETYEELMADGEKNGQGGSHRGTFPVESPSLSEHLPALRGDPRVNFRLRSPQALFFANHEALVEWLEPKAGNLAEWLLIRDDPQLVAEEAYLTVLSRLPTEEEIALTKQHLDMLRGEERPAAITELLWSLAASAEFRLNH